jgi:hypothetical protein
MKEIRLLEILVPMRKTIRGKIPENRNLLKNCCVNLVSSYEIIYSLCNSLFISSTVTVVAVPGSNLNRVAYLLIQIRSAFYRNSIMNAVIIPSHTSRPPLHIYQCTDRS